MTSRSVTQDYLVTTTYEVLKTFRTKGEAIAYANAARGFLPNVTIEAKTANR